MTHIFSPQWFLRFDIGIEIFSFIVLLIFFYISIRNYRINKNKKMLFLGIGFLLIALAEASTILTKFVIYYPTTLTRTIGNIIVTIKTYKVFDDLYELGFFLHKLLTLAGLYIIYRLPLKKMSFGDVIIATFFVIISALVGQTISFVFHFVTIILISLIIINYLNIYKKNKLDNTKILILAFTILLLAQLAFVLSSGLYVLAQILQLIGYLILVLLIFRINKYERFKRK